MSLKLCVLPDWKRKILALVAGFGTTGFLHVVRDFTFKCGFDKVVADLKSNKSEMYTVEVGVFTKKCTFTHGLLGGKRKTRFS